MPGTRQKLSIVEFTINGGDPIAVKTTSSLDLGGIMRESETTDAGEFYTERPAPFKAEIDVIVSKDTNPLDWQAITDALITVRLDTGQIFTVNNAWVAESKVLNPSDGTLRLAITGNKAERSS